MDKKKELERLAAQIRSCRRCRLFETRIHALPGEGNRDARLFLIAQAPGEVEDNKGSMFLGPSGKILDQLFEKSGIKRNQIYMTNLIKCMLPKCRKPKRVEIDRCSPYLDQEIDLIQPEILVPLGHYATRYVFTKYGLDIPSKHEFYEVYATLFFSNNQKIFPLQHPAAVLHKPSMKTVLENNYQKLSVLSHPCKWYPVCPMKRYCEQGRLPKKWVELYCNGDWSRCIRFQMEQRGEFHPDSMLPDGSIDETLKTDLRK